VSEEAKMIELDETALRILATLQNHHWTFELSQDPDDSSNSREFVQLERRFRVRVTGLDHARQLLREQQVPQCDREDLEAFMGAFMEVVVNARREGNTSTLVAGLRDLGLLFKFLGPEPNSYEQACLALEEALEVCRGRGSAQATEQEQELQNILRELGLSYVCLGRREQALPHFLEALDITRRISPVDLQGLCDATERVATAFLRNSWNSFYSPGRAQ
jgi:tetratricopeptide (TPR) repeat protein